MDSIINPETKRITEEGISMCEGEIDIEVFRSMFDTKIARLLDGTWGASEHLCTAIDSQIKSLVGEIRFSN